MENGFSFVPLVIVVCLAFLVPIALTRLRHLRLPIVVGEIIAGVLVGRSGLEWVAHHDPVLDLLSEFGFVFLMFLSGMEIDFSNLGASTTEDKEKSSIWFGPLGLAILMFSGTLILSLALGFGFSHMKMVSGPWMIALILSTTSLGVVVPVLKERRLTSGRYGQSLLVSALIADFVTMTLITVFVAVHSQGPTLDILFVGVLFLVFFLALRFGEFFFNNVPGLDRLIRELSGTTAQIKMRAAFTMMLIFVGLSEVLGTEIILGAFLAGAMVSLLRRPEDRDLIQQLDALGYGFFIPVFFIMVGVDFRLDALLESKASMALVPLLLLAAALVKGIPALLFRLVFSWKETLAAGALLSSRLSLIIAASAIGLQLGVVSDSVNAAIILVALITVAASPAVFLRLIPKPDLTQKPPIVIMGDRSVGRQVAQQLLAHHERVVLMDTDPEVLAGAEAMGLKTAVADPDFRHPPATDLLKSAKSLVSVYADVAKNFRICQLARQVFGISHVVTRVDIPAELEKFEALGVTTMNPAVDQAMLLTILVRNPGMYELLTRTSDDKDVAEITVINPRFVGKRLDNTPLPGDLLITALRRDGHLLIPHGHTRLKHGDRLTIVGSSDHVDVFAEDLTNTP